MQRIIFLFLRAITSIQRWLNNRLTKTGKYVFAGLIITAVIGIDTNLTLTYQIFTLLAALFLLSLFSSIIFRLDAEVSRVLPQFVTAGETFQYQISIKNLGNNVEEGLLLQDMMTDPRPSYTEFRLTNKTASSKGQFRKSLFRRWRILVDEKCNCTIREQSLPKLLKNHIIEVTVEVDVDHRGYIEFVSTIIARPDPLGLFKAVVKIPHRQSLLVLPKRYDLPQLRLPGTRVYQHGGVTLAASKGDTEEFVGLRDYREGDPLQTIHWKSFARIGKPVVKEYQDEFFERHALVLDTFTWEGSNKVFEEAVSLAASFACTVETQENLLDLMFVGKETYTFTAGIGQLHTNSLLEVLASVRLCDDKSFNELSKSILERRSSLSGCILILTDWDNARRELIDELTAHGLPFELFIIKETKDTIEEEEHGFHVLEVDEMAAGLAKL